MIILGRLLKLDAEGGEIDVPITIHKPVDVQDHWRCDYEIGWPEGVRRAKGLGIDSVQVLLIALMNTSAEIHASNAHPSGKLIWDRPGAGYGFPLAAGIRDLYEDDDKLL
ncbi:MAG TPA: hypothetical protein VH249_02090 [Xanthobacteraceae bacterium]|jgi:hypothetical protein|nr:hypothetical protein [Xanthobacteraceae bacterium]